MLHGNYISTVGPNQISGGWDGMNASLFHELSKHFQLVYVGPIRPQSNLWDRLVSKLRRKLGLGGKYHFFSNERLEKIARAIKLESSTTACFDYFHGITPWIRTHSPRPYFAFADACFATYYESYQQRDRFQKSDLERICHLERQWLQHARRVFFTSRYAIDECCSGYDLGDESFEYVGLGAGLPAPSQDVYNSQHQLLFIAVDYNRKGGDVCLAAFKKFRQQIPTATLTFIGAKPPAYALEVQGVTWAGYLRKSVPEELSIFQSHLSSAFALVLPTVSDMTPVVVIEAGLYGCPTVAPRAFGIPEMIDHGHTGALTAVPPTADDYATVLLDWATHTQDYLKFRVHVRAKFLQRFTWETVAARITASITECVTTESPAAGT